MFFVPKRLFKEKKTSYWIALLGKISAVVIAIILFFSIINIIFSAYLSIRNPVQERFRTDTYKIPYPYIMFKGLPYWEDHNQEGYRGPYPVVPKPVDEYRICILGGSTVYIGDPSLPVLLEEEFHKRGYYNVRVYNFGVISAVSSQELMTIVTNLSNLQPDLIIQYDGVNDLYHPLYYDPRPGYPYDYMMYEVSPLLYPERMSIWKFFISKLPVVQFFAERFAPEWYLNQFVPLTQIRNEAMYGSESWKNTIISVYSDNLQKAHKISHAFGSEYIAILQPILYDKLYLTDEEKPLVMSTEQEWFRDMKKRVVDAMGNKNVYFVDLSSAVANVEETMFMDIMHLYQESQARIAFSLYNIVVNIVNKDNAFY